MIHNWIAWLPELLPGAILSVQVVAVSLLIGIPFGCVLAFGAMSKSKLVMIPTLVIVELGRGTPVLIVLYFMYYGLPSLNIVASSFVAAVAGLSFTVGGYTSEIFRAGIQAIPKGELEAGSALGMRRAHVMRDVVLPQGIRLAMPALLGFSITVFQATALTFTIALPELLSRAYSIGSRTFDYLSVLTLAGLIYLIITVPASLSVQRLEQRRGYRVRKRRLARKKTSTSNTP